MALGSGVFDVRDVELVVAALCEGSYCLIASKLFQAWTSKQFASLTLGAPSSAALFLPTSPY